MKKLVVDIGNTIAKSADVLNGQIEDVLYWEDIQELASYINSGDFDSIAISSVSGTESKLISQLDVSVKPLVLSSNTPLPIKLHYKTTETLGVDRIAGTVGAYYLYPKTSCLVIDIGTCITYDLIDSEGVYHGGAISPGLEMRLNGMHHFTGKLPSISMDELNNEIPHIGKSTFESMSSGAFNGMLMELNGFIDHFSAKYQAINIIMTGGDSYRFESLINHPIFVAPKLVLQGLNCILDYNEKL